MKIVAPALSVNLRADECMRLIDAAGTVLHSHHGSLWITQAGDAADYVLEPGKMLTLDKNGMSLICALSDAELRVEFVRPRRIVTGVAASCVQPQFHPHAAKG